MAPQHYVCSLFVCINPVSTPSNRVIKSQSLIAIDCQDPVCCCKVSLGTDGRSKSQFRFCMVNRALMTPDYVRKTMLTDGLLWNQVKEVLAQNLTNCKPVKGAAGQSKSLIFLSCSGKNWALLEMKTKEGTSSPRNWKPLVNELRSEMWHINLLVMTNKGQSCWAAETTWSFVPE